jgi:hypothetical protein
MLRVATFQAGHDIIAVAIELVWATYPEAREESEQVPELAYERCWWTRRSAEHHGNMFRPS